MKSLAHRVGVFAIIAFAAACGRPPGVPDSPPSGAQKLPFERESTSGGMSPSRTLIPATNRLLEGTSLVIRLKKTLSSASAHAGEGFDGALDEPIVIDGQTMIPSSAAVTGRVLDAHHSQGPNDPGYLRVGLISVEVQGKTLLIDTSSIFVKAHHGAAVSPAQNTNEVAFAPDRRLTFRLAEAIDLP